MTAQIFADSAIALFVRDVLLTGLRSAPACAVPVVSWDFDVETD